MRSSFSRGRVAVPIIVALGLLAGAPVAGAQSLSWLGPVTLESNGGSQAVGAVSCPSTSQCTSVDANGQQVTFNPATGATIFTSSLGARGTYAAIACSSARQCTAVSNLGDEVTFDPGTGAFAGGGLQSIETNSATNPVSPLNDVACPLSTQCVAVDQAGNAYRFDPTSAGSSDGGTHETNTPLSAVACSVDGTRCVAVASGGTSDQEVYLGSSPTPLGTTTPLTGLSCKADASQCVAVDTAGEELTINSSGSVTNTSTVDPGTSSSPNPLTRVRCAADFSQCTAVDRVGNEVTFGPGAGSVIKRASVDGIQLLSDVACPATTQCTAVDNVGREVTFNPATGAAAAGGGHSVAPTPIASVACPTARECVAVEAGQREIMFDPTTNQITGQNGGGQVGPATIDTTSNRLVSVSCPAANQCTAVDAAAFKTTFDPQTGYTDAVGTTAIEPGQSLQAVACPSVSQCTAVDTRGAEVTFAPHGNIQDVNQTSPTVIDGLPDGILVSVSCPTTTQCTTVDRDGREITFDPTTSNQPVTGDPTTPTRVDVSHHPSSLSCPTGSTTQCTLVDDAGRAYTFNPGTIRGPQDAAGGTVDETAGETAPLSSVSCPLTSACAAVDLRGNAVQFNPASPGTTATVTQVEQTAPLNAISCLSSPPGNPSSPGVVSADECVVGDAEGNAFSGFLAPLAAQPPAITGTAQQGQTLTEHRAVWNNYPPTGFSVQWLDCDDSGCSPIPGASGQTYTLQPSDDGETIAVQETATNLGGTSDPSTSAQTSPVLPLAPVNTGPPTIVGTVQQGQTLAAQHGQWANFPTGFTLQWLSCDSGGANCAPIPGATTSTYVPDASQIGRRLEIQETASNQGGTGHPAASAPTAPVASARAADIQAYTAPAGAVQAQSATLLGAIYTQSAPASWHFDYGTTSGFGASTPDQSVAAGNPGEISVQSAIGALHPGTTIYYRLVETVSPGAFQTGVQSIGQTMHFTTQLAGSLDVQGGGLKLSRGRIQPRVSCVGSPVPCTGVLGLTFAWVTGGRHHQHWVSQSCGTSPVVLPGSGTRTIRFGVSSGCQALLRAKHLRQLTETFAVISTSGQRSATRTVRIRR